MFWSSLKNIVIRFVSTKDRVDRMVIVEGHCTQLTSSSLHTYIIIGWHKSIVSSDWSDTMVWFGQILLLLSFYHPIYMIIGCWPVVSVCRESCYQSPLSLSTLEILEQREDISPEILLNAFIIPIKSTQLTERRYLMFAVSNYH